MGETTDKSAKTVSKRPGFFQRTSIYGFELFTALFGLFTTLVVVDYGIFALFNYLRSFSGGSSYFGDITIWIVAAMVVWLPVTIVFYLRSRSEYERHPLHGDSPLHKVLVSIYYVSVLFGAIGLSFALIYALVHLTVSPDESVADVLVRVVVPAFIATLVHVGMMFAYPKSRRPSRKIFATVFGILAAVVAVSLFAVSAGLIRSNRMDEITASDLNAIQASVTSYASENKTVPAKIDAVKDLSKDTQARIDHYTYSVQASDKYTLCADFLTDTTAQQSRGEVVPMVAQDDGSTSSDGYSSYMNFTVHAKGTVCFKLRAYTNIEPFITDKTAN